jgi:hypothetical protein
LPQPLLLLLPPHHDLSLTHPPCPVSIPELSEASVLPPTVFVPNTVGLLLQKAGHSVFLLLGRLVHCQHTHTHTHTHTCTHTSAHSHQCTHVYTHHIYLLSPPLPVGTQLGVCPPTGLGSLTLPTSHGSYPCPLLPLPWHWLSCPATACWLVFLPHCSGCGCAQLDPRLLAATHM